jgi:hypothetical protein
MTDDLVNELREEAECYRGKTKDRLLAAVSRIEQLEAALKRAAHELDMEGLENDYAITALGEKKDD